MDFEETNVVTAACPDCGGPMYDGTPCGEPPIEVAPIVVEQQVARSFVDLLDDRAKAHDRKARSLALLVLVTIVALVVAALLVVSCERAPAAHAMSCVPWTAGQDGGRYFDSPDDLSSFGYLGLPSGRGN